MLRKLVKFRGRRFYCSLAPEQTQEVIAENPSLAGIPHENWQTTHSVFKNYGFKSEDILQLIKNNKSLLTRPSNTLTSSVEFWRNFQFTERNFQELIIEHPELLDLTNHREITNIISYIKYRVQTPKNIWYLLINSPNILSNKENIINDYFTYLEVRMRLPTYEIVKSNVFSKPLDTLKYRHIFLERLGIFKPRSLKSDPNEPTKNPKLYQIIGTEDKEFCKKICGVSLIEFESFMELLDKEKLKKENANSNDDDDDYVEDSLLK